VVRLAAPVTCSGRVLDADGNPVAGAVIVLHDGFSEAMSCVTDAFGLYRFEGVGEGSFRLAASHRVLQSGMKAVQAEAGGDARIDFQLPLGAAFAGSARGADGAVFDDGYAELYDRWTRERVDAVPLGPSGAFRFASLYPGRDYVVAVTSGFASGEFAAVGGAVGGGSVEVSADGSVTAYAYDFDGDPIVGAAMRLAREDGLAAYGLEADHITGGDGSTTWHGLRSGVNYRLIARAPGKAALEVRGIRFDQGHAAVALPPEAPVEGVVTNADGDPLAGVTVRVLRRDALAAPALYTTTDGDGRFTLRGAASGEVTVSALRVGYVVASTPVTLPPQGVSGLLFMLQAVPD